MNSIRQLINTFLFLLFISNICDVYASEIVFRIVEYNKDTQSFTLAYTGEKPAGSYAFFESKYGSTSGNRYNQIPRNQQAELTLVGWQGCVVNSITFNMCSNRTSGTVGYSINDGENTLYTEKPVEFADEKWFGQWVPKDYGIYVDITKEMDLPAFTEEHAVVTVKGGTPEGSVYLNSITIDYTAPESMTLESPLGWKFEKLDAKSTLNDGDIVMLYRSGSAAADFDGMETSHYLDVVALPTTADVNDPDVELFTLNKVDGASWTFTDQYNRKLGATKLQSLAWGDGVTTWTVKLTRDGAEIASANANYGMLRYNAPDGSYARFWNYKTSSSLQLPYLYRRQGQLSAVKCTEISFAETEITVDICEGALALKPTMKPANTTDMRVDWSSSDNDVATVHNGFVNLLSVGETMLTARSHDGGAETTIKLTVVDEATRLKNVINSQKVSAKKLLKDNKVQIVNGNQKYTAVGQQCE